MIGTRVGRVKSAPKPLLGTVVSRGLGRPGPISYLGLDIFETHQKTFKVSKGCVFVGIITRFNILYSIPKR